MVLSLIFVENLVHAVIACIEHPAAAGETFLVSDDHDVSTPELIRMIATALEKPPRLFPVPALMLFVLGRLIGKGKTVVTIFSDTGERYLSTGLFDNG